MLYEDEQMSFSHPGNWTASTEVVDGQDVVADGQQSRRNFDLFPRGLVALAGVYFLWGAVS